MSDMSAAIGLARTSSGLPPPKASAAACEMNDHVTASTSPRVASARLARRVRSWIGVSTGLSTPGRRGSGVTGTRSTPMIRTTSSTRSAFMVTSGRQVGTATVIVPVVRCGLQAKPSASRIAVTSLTDGSMPASRLISATGKSITIRGSGTSPATMISLGVPPQRSSTMRVASSSPGTMKAGSTPRSKRWRASEWMPSFRPVAATLSGSHSADSISTSVVASVQPDASPPMMPAIDSTPLSSAMTQISGSSV